MRTRSLYLAFGVLTLAGVLACSGCSADEDTVATDEPIESTEPEPVDATEPVDMSLESSAFEDAGVIPVRFAREGVDGGQNVSIPLSWADAPAGTESFALLMFDTHPVADKWVHWMVVDVPAETTQLSEGASGAGMPTGTRELSNTWGDSGYGGPEPPEDTGGHFYLTTVYALDIDMIEIADDADTRAFKRAIDGHVLAEAKVEGSLGR